MNSSKANGILIALVLLFAVTAAWLGYNFQNEKATARHLEQERSTLNENYDALTAEMTDLQASYDELASENQELNAELETQMQELQRQREVANRLIRSGGADKVKEAQLLIAQLREENQQLRDRVDELIMENEALTAENERLNDDLDNEKQLTAKLTKDNQELTVELVEVTEDRDRLVPIANYGQVVQLSGMTVEPVKENDRKARNARKADQVKLCFQMDGNPVAELGDQHYLIRIVTPEGATLFEEQKGSGTFTPYEENSAMKYTAEAVVQFQNEVDDNVCWYWDQSGEFQKGEYTAEIYHRGHKVGADKFEL